MALRFRSLAQRPLTWLYLAVAIRYCYRWPEIMFDSLIVGHRDTMNASVDVGFLVEAMLFHQEVTLFANSGMLKSLLEFEGYGPVLDLVRTGRLRLKFTANLCGVMSKEVGAQTRYDFGLAEVQGHDLHSNLSKFIAEQQPGGSSGKLRRTVEKFLKKASDYRFGTDVPDAMRSEVDNRERLRQTAVYVLRSKVPEMAIPDDAQFALDRQDNGEYLLDTSIDFAEAQKRYSHRVPATHSTLQPELILSTIFNSISDQMLSMEYSKENIDTELATDSLSAALQQARIADVAKRLRNASDEAENFIEHVLPDVVGVREAINSRQRTLKDAMNLLDESEKFREWMKGADLSSGIIAAYQESLKSTQFYNRLEKPGRALRWFLLVGSGIAVDAALQTGSVGKTTGTMVSAALDGADNPDVKLMKRLLLGWKPNQFVEGPLKKFLIHRS